MAGVASAGYLPPVVAQILVDADAAMRKIAAFKAAIESLEKSNPTVVLHTEVDQVDAAAALGKIEVVKKLAEQRPIALRTSLDTASEVRTVAGVEALKAALEKPIRITTTGDVARLAYAAQVFATLSGGKGGDKGGGGGFWGSLLGSMFGKGGGGIGGFLGLGKGFGGMAGFGSILSLAGFGFEHLLTTGIGLAGSAAGAGLGLGLLGAGSLGVAGVGAGSDLLVMSSALKDTQSLYGAYNNLASAVATYGKNSFQAQQATQQLNGIMATLGNTAGVKAEAGVARAAAALNTYWDKATSAARVQAANIMMQVLGLARTYVPLIAAAAAHNLGVINRDLKPLFAWLQGPQGTGIFKQLENVFATDLPYAMSAFTNAIEIVIKSLGFLSGYVGSFTKWLAGFFAQWNTPSGMAKIEKAMRTLIGLWRDWWALIKILAKVLVDFFTQGAGLGTGIVKALTGMLTNLDKWIRSSSGKNAVHTLFAVHLQEILALMHLVAPLIGAFAQLYLAVAVPLTMMVSAIAQFVGWAVKIPGVGPLLAWGVAAGILLKQMQLLGPFFVLMKGLGGAMGLSGFAAGAAGGGGISGGLGALMLSFGKVIGVAAGAIIGAVIGHWIGGIFGGSSGANKGALIGGGIGLGAGAGLLIGGPIGAAIGALVGGIAGTLVAFWKPITHTVSQWFTQIGNFFKYFNLGIYWANVTKAIGQWMAGLGHWFSNVNWGKVLGTILGALGTWIGAAAKWFTSFNWGKILQRIGTTLGQWIGAAVKWFTGTAIPAIPHILWVIDTALGAWAVGLVHWFFFTAIPAIPGVLWVIGKALSDFAVAVAKWFANAAANIFKGILNFGSGFSGGIVHGINPGFDPKAWGIPVSTTAYTTHGGNAATISISAPINIVGTNSPKETALQVQNQLNSLLRQLRGSPYSVRL